MPPLSSKLLTRLNQHRYPISVMLFVTFIAIVGSSLETPLRYDRQAILAGEIWRLFSCHFVHMSWGHIGMDMGGLALIWLLFGHLLSTREWWLLTLITGLLISLGILLFHPELRLYSGYSGVFHGVMVCASILDWRAGQREGKIVLLIVTSKLVFEQLLGPVPGSEATAGGPVLVDAHLYGAITGLLLTPFFIIYHRRHTNHDSPL